MKKAKVIGIAIVLILAIVIFISSVSKEKPNNTALEESNAPSYTDYTNSIQEKQPAEIATRESAIPADAVKMTPETDASPVKSLSSEYENPAPADYVINTAGAEDSSFVLPDGNTLYFFFTPDVRVPVEKQILDKVTGIWVAKKVNGEWQKPERVVLQDAEKLSGDGCEFILNNKMWFCTAREGYTGLHWATADLIDGKWKNWKVDDFNPDYEVGELHMSKDGSELYFHSSRAGGKGGLDIWVSKKANGEWQSPENLENVNSEFDEGWPALNPNENELWISKNYGVWRSKKVNGKWQSPEQMFSPLAGEATIDENGNVYFTHHFFNKDKMIEADIYFAKKK